MKQQRIETLRIAVAETSVIVRSGVVAVLKRLPGVQVRPVEVASPDALENCLHMDTPDILLVNPTFGGWFNVAEFRTDSVHASVKCIALNCNITDTSILQAFDESITLHEDISSLQEKILRVVSYGISEADYDEEKDAPALPSESAEQLSQREREIVICVVKGMTNKEIADKLYLSVHTVNTHRRNIARKLEIHSAAGLTIYAIVNKLVELGEVKL
ncbi:MAG: response regulator transcription factor [Bacteroidaceae bacterium]|nr:response regulator transcription factor [Bacteroidaceae bacterium]